MLIFRGRQHQPQSEGAGMSNTRLLEHAAKDLRLFIGQDPANLVLNLAMLLWKVLRDWRPIGGRRDVQTLRFWRWCFGLRRQGCSLLDQVDNRLGGRPAPPPHANNLEIHLLSFLPNPS